MNQLRVDALEALVSQVKLYPITCTKLPEEPGWAEIMIGGSVALVMRGEHINAIWSGLYREE